MPKTKKIKVVKELDRAMRCVESICPHLGIKFKYNNEEPSIELDDSFYISWTNEDVEKIRTAYPYTVSVATYDPGDRETPPDYDIKDLKSFNNDLQAVKYAIQQLFESKIDSEFEGFSEQLYYDDLDQQKQTDKRW